MTESHVVFRLTSRSLNFLVNF